MNYDLMVKKMPKDVFDLIVCAMILHKKIDSNKCDRFNIDTVSLSLLLSILLINDEVSKIFSDVGFNSDYIQTKLGIDVSNVTPLEFDKFKKLKDISFYYNMNFKYYIGELEMINGGTCITLSQEKMIKLLFDPFDRDFEHILDVLYISSMDTDVFTDAKEYIINSIDEILNTRNNFKKVLIDRIFNKNDYLLSLRLMKKKFLYTGDYNIDDKETNYDVEEIDKPKELSLGSTLTDIEYTTNPAVAREAELELLLISLLTPNSSPLLVGDSGVGKSALVYGLAYNIQMGNVPDGLKSKKILSISSSDFVSGTSYRGNLEKKFNYIINFLLEHKEYILFIDEIHTLVGAGCSVEDSNDLANMFKPYIGNGSISVIGATTNDEYLSYIKKDRAFERRFDVINVNELSDDKLLNVLHEYVSSLESSLGIRFDFNEDERVVIYSNLISFTNPKNRDINYSSNNPDLLLSIINKCFGIASVRSDDKIILDDVIKSISTCNKVYATKRNFYVSVLKSKLMSRSTDDIVVKYTDNVVEFKRK